MMVADKPKVVVLCGSTRFGDAFRDALARETLAGHIVISVGLLGHETGLDMSGPVKRGLDELHKRKIDIGDEILVLNPIARVCPSCKSVWRHDGIRVERCSCGAEIGGVAPAPYVGESTRGEIEYARRHGKAVRWLEPPADETAGRRERTH